MPEPDEPFVVEDDLEEDEDDRRLRRVRAERATLTRGAARRARDWSLIAGVVLFGVGVQLAYLAYVRLRNGQLGVALVQATLAVLALAASVFLYRRFRSLSGAARTLRRDG
jgi:hypothetical protein